MEKRSSRPSNLDHVGEWLCYTDGSCKPGEDAPGGWAFVLKGPTGNTIEKHGHAVRTLAKVMEYRAVAEAVDALPDGARAAIFSDNESLTINLGKKLADWRASSFANVDPAIVALVRRIDDAIQNKALDVRFQWVRAHNGNAGNERADFLAAEGAREAKRSLTSDRPRRRS